MTLIFDAASHCRCATSYIHDVTVRMTSLVDTVDVGALSLQTSKQCGWFVRRSHSSRSRWTPAELVARSVRAGRLESSKRRVLMRSHSRGESTCRGGCARWMEGTSRNIRSLQSRHDYKHVNNLKVHQRKIKACNSCFIDVNLKNIRCCECHQ